MTEQELAYVLQELDVVEGAHGYLFHYDPIYNKYRASTTWILWLVHFVGMPIMEQG